MEDEDGINIKLELSKDKNQNLSIITYFNTNSPNFLKEGDFYLWRPTLKEKEFLIDAFQLIIKSIDEKREDKKIFKFSDKISDDIKNYSSNENLKPQENNINSEINQDDLINQTIKNNQHININQSEEERERKIEKILRENKRNKDL